MRCALSTLALASAFAIGTSAVAGAGAKTVRWVGAIVDYDGNIWATRATASRSSLAFACIAPDCPGEPTVFAYASLAGDDGEAGDAPCPVTSDGGTERPLAEVAAPLDSLAIDFTLFSLSSGCAARDAPIFQACGKRGNVAYRMTTAVGHGCNFGPALPTSRMVELLRGVKGDH